MGRGPDTAARGGGPASAVDVGDALGALFESTDDFVFAKGPDFRFLFANPAFARVVGGAPADLVGRLDTDFWQFDDHGETSVRALDLAVLAGRTIHGARGTGIRDGMRHVFELNKTPLRDARGAIIGVLTHGRDVTEAARADEALRASEARYRLLLEHAPVAMYVHDGVHIRFANRATAELMGAASPEALVGYPVLQIAHPDDRPALVARVRAVTAGQVVSPRMAFRARGVDGRELDVEVLATACVYEGRSAIQVVMLDETARRRALRERDALEAQLRHAQRLDAVGTLAGGIAHDFNNMLAIISASAELASVELAPAHPARAWLGELLGAADRAAALVHGILAFSRKQPVEPQPLRLADVVTEAVRLLRATLPATIALVLDVRAPDTVVVADATQVHQALLNLCTNAWHAIPAERGGQITVSVEHLQLDEAAAQAHAHLGAGAYARVGVRDDGVGMDAATVARIFDPFFTTKAAGEGTGLGLSMVYGIMRGHLGAVTVDSTPGAGSAFGLYFPATDQPVAPRRAAAPATATRAIRVLFVDDEPAVRAVTSRGLELRGCQVTACASLAEAERALADDAQAYDVVVTDHNMPGGSGVEFAALAHRLRPALPSVLVSGYLDAATRTRAEHVGVRAFLGKPCSADQLLAAIERAIAPA